MLDIWNFVHGIIVQKHNAVCLWNNVSNSYVRRPSRSRLETNSLNPYGKIENSTDVSLYIEVVNGIPRDKRCGCVFCQNCRCTLQDENPSIPCSLCSGNCAVCLRVVYPSPQSIGDRWDGLFVNIELLHFAAENGHQDEVERALDLIADNERKKTFLSSLDKKGKIPLHYAAANGHQAIVEILINSIADNEWKKSFLSIQEYCKNTILTDEKWGKTPLHYAGSKRTSSYC